MVARKQIEDGGFRIDADARMKEEQRRPAPAVYCLEVDAVDHH